MASSNVERREIAAEQTYVDVVYERLEESAKVAQSLVTEGFARGHVGNEGGLVERDAMVYQASRRLSALNAAHDGLVFGRLNLLDGESRYIGRIGVRDDDREILLVDWRAPAAAVFYQATAQDPAGVIRRRVLRCAGDKVVGVEDDLLDAENAPDDLVVVGEGALLASLSRARDCSMHSVVATIQKEQDEAIRAPSRGATIIGGGPGTGKTVVALHRAAYLLYTDRRRFESGGVLVVGPVQRLHELHRARAAEPRRDERDAAVARRGRRRRQGRPARRRRGGGGQGLGAHDAGAAPPRVLTPARVSPPSSATSTRTTS